MWPLTSSRVFMLDTEYNYRMFQNYWLSKLGFYQDLSSDDYLFETYVICTILNAKCLETTYFSRQLYTSMKSNVKRWRWWNWSWGLNFFICSIFSRIFRHIFKVSMKTVVRQFNYSAMKRKDHWNFTVI